jgi:hypothetical protein
MIGKVSYHYNFVICDALPDRRPDSQARHPMDAQMSRFAGANFPSFRAENF